MFDLNPFRNPDAVWQHTLMVLVTLGLGYMTGLIYGNDKVRGLKIRLAKLDKDLEACQNVKFGNKNQDDSPSIAVAETSPSNHPTTSEKPQSADLKIIEGIGPKIELALNQSGIHTFMQLKDMNPDEITQILKNSELSFQVHDPTTWPQQAELAAEQKWEELREWQNELNKGKEQ